MGYTILNKQTNLIVYSKIGIYYYNYNITYDDLNHWNGISNYNNYKMEIGHTLFF